MKKIIIMFIILGLISIGVGIYITNRNKFSENNNPSYDSAKLSAKNSTNAENTTTDLNSSENQNSGNYNSDAEESTQESKKTETETQISEFTTKIYTKDDERQNNINITCSTLNNTYVEVGETFSFCKTVGKATTSKGYEKADVFKDGEVVQALGGGNCQVSTTLYNAVLEVDGLNVTERHKHSNSVPYIKNGKDAAVSYGSYDFKFVNNTSNKIKISASCDSDYVYIKIFKLE
ncbi:MAG TPA: factor for cell wall maintenance or synthesis YoaR [Clostridiales bacterium]|nr:factor for cell wall maintenance or synthesis YoaR [Clostridiales bacterium]